MSRIYYKVLTEDRFSIMINYLGNAAVQYKVKRWTKPVLADTPLMVFDNRERAAKYSKSVLDYGEGIVVACKIEPFVFPPSQLVNLKETWGFDSVETWNRAMNGALHMWSIPCGTVFASSVFCLE